MFKCEFCQCDHDGLYASGRFCSVECSRRYTQSLTDDNETKEAVCVKCGCSLYIKKRASLKTCKCKLCKTVRAKLNKAYVTKPHSMHCLVCGCEISKNNKTGMCYNCDVQRKKNDYITNWLCVGNTKTKCKPLSAIREYILKQQNGKCSVCGCDPVWNGLPLIFILDHINGEHFDNSPANLRLVCSNCDSQLPTYKRKNRKNGDNVYDKEYRIKHYHDNK